MTQQELRDIEDRWRFGANTREDVRKLLDEVWKNLPPQEDTEKVRRIVNKLTGGMQ